MNREILLAKIKSEASKCGEHPPVVELDDFFEENRQEDSIAPNQVGYGRPSLSELYQRFRSIRDRDDVDAVLVSLHDEWEDALDCDDLWPACDCIHIYTSARQAEVEGWIEGLCADGAISGWQRGRGDHPVAPQVPVKSKIYTVVWD